MAGYNIWQLQAIDGVVPDDVTVAASRAAASVFYGANPATRLAGFYEMQVDIDATSTRDWDGGRGFDPIGDGSKAFLGAFDGGGNVVRGLRIDRADDNEIGLFAALNATVANLGLDDARITGGNNVGGLAGRLDSAGLYSSWFAGQVEGDDAVGGLAGYALAGSDVADSWAAVDIVAPVGSRAGELAGGLMPPLHCRDCGAKVICRRTFPRWAAIRFPCIPTAFALSMTPLSKTRQFGMLERPKIFRF